MELGDWRVKNKNRRNYAHFDVRISIDDVWSYINNPKNIEVHSFYPFIHYKLTYNKFNKDKGIKAKEREICYSAHIDRCIFQFYAFKLNQLYNKRALADGISNSAIAYRDELKKNNIHFAKQAIDFIRNQSKCFIIVGDFTKFFDSLDHKYLKARIANLLDTKELPADYYAIYKNITRYSVWNLESLLDINGLKHNKEGIKKLNQLEKVVTKSQFKQNKKDCIQKHKECFGIPQGSAISAVLSNIYMLEFDKKINDYVISNQGLYMRYSDDFIIILPNNGIESFREQYTFINSIVKSIPKLELQVEKTQTYEYCNKSIRSCNDIVMDSMKDNKCTLDYLGFSFDGNMVTIRDKTITKYYYRLYRKIKTITKNNGITKYRNRISFKNLYKKYSIKGAYDKKGNFITYVNRAKKVFGENEAIDRSTRKHMQKIRKKLNMISYK